MEKLKGCPFCGGEAKLIRDFMPNDYRKGNNKRFWYMIECTNSGCEICPQTGLTNARKKLIKAWNTRYVGRGRELV